MASSFKGPPLSRASTKVCLSSLPPLCCSAETSSLVQLLVAATAIALGLPDIADCPPVFAALANEWEAVCKVLATCCCDCDGLSSCTLSRQAFLKTRGFNEVCSHDSTLLLLLADSERGQGHVNIERLLLGQPCNPELESLFAACSMETTDCC